MANGMVTVSTDERDLFFVRGSYVSPYSDSPRELALASLKYVFADLSDIKRTYFRLGFHLDEFERLKYYYDFGYSCLTDFAEVNLGMDKTAVSRCLNVFRKFAYREGGYISPVRKMWVDERYQNYSYSQLCEMLSMSEAECEKVRPDMTVMEIRGLKRSFRKRGGCDVATVIDAPCNYFCNREIRTGFMNKISDMVSKSGFIHENLCCDNGEVMFSDCENDYVIKIEVRKKEV